MQVDEQSQMTAPARTPQRLFELKGLRFRLWPIVLAGALMQGVLWPARELARWIFQHEAAFFRGQVWAFVGLAMVFQTLAGLLCILVMRRELPQADHLPAPAACRPQPGRSGPGHRRGHGPP